MVYSERGASSVTSAGPTMERCLFVFAGRGFAISMDAVYCVFLALCKARLDALGGNDFERGEEKRRERAGKEEGDVSTRIERRYL